MYVTLYHSGNCPVIKDIFNLLFIFWSLKLERASTKIPRISIVDFLWFSVVIACYPVFPVNCNEIIGNNNNIHKCIKNNNPYR